MSPALLAVIVSLVEEAIKLEPGVVAAFKSIFAKDNATPADWQAVKDAVLASRYEDFVPDTAIGKTPPPTV